MKLREIDKKILIKAKRKLKLRGEQKKMVDATGIHRNILSHFANGYRTTASEPLADKFENYIRSL